MLTDFKGSHEHRAKENSENKERKTEENRRYLKHYGNKTYTN
jgi:hypothetical protein